ncbi:MAG: hypothetical protein WBF93_13495 [Pirellulales bacterium]
MPDEIEKRVEQYQGDKKLDLESCLGAGTQGSVFVFNNPLQSRRVAVKFHQQEIAYQRERDVYLRLNELEIVEVHAHEVPQLIDFDDELLALEMTIVSPPFVLDFGGAYLDRPPDYSPEVWADWRAMKSEAFEGNWPAVQQILAEFESYGIYVADLNPGNIKF